MLLLPILMLHAAPTVIPARVLLPLCVAAQDGGDPDAGSAVADAGQTNEFIPDGGQSIGNQPGAQDQDTVGVPSKCKTSDDCPLYFDCVANKCKPQSQPQKGGCSCGIADGVALPFLFLGLLFRRRRPV